MGPNFNINENDIENKKNQKSTSENKNKEFYIRALNQIGMP
jgi:hypothetical protein